MTVDTLRDVDSIIDLVDLSLDFAKVNRATMHQDGKRPESDSDHTFSLSLIACNLADKYYKDLDLGLVSQFALIHDLVEVYAGDLDQVSVTKQSELDDKKLREAESFSKIKNKFDKTFPWTAIMIAKYESQDTREARFIKLVDKILTEPTNILNRCAYFRNNNISDEYFEEYFDKKYKKCEKIADGDFDLILEIYKEINSKMRKIYYNKIQ